MKQRLLAGLLAVVLVLGLAPAALAAAPAEEEAAQVLAALDIMVGDESGNLNLGAKGRDIRSQFIIEAGTTSAIGGVIGIILGVVLANVFTALVGVVMAGAEGFSAVPSAGGIAVSFGVSVGIGILFGYLPANKAAKLNPIDALRYD